MTANPNCRSCGSKLTRLQGATGRISICSRCGWSRVELTNGGRTPGVSARLSRHLAAAQPSVS